MQHLSFGSEAIGTGAEYTNNIPKTYDVTIKGARLGFIAQYFKIRV